MDVSKSIFMMSRAMVFFRAVSITQISLIPSFLFFYLVALCVCRAQIRSPGPQSLFCASPTFALTGSCVAMWCWSPMPTQLSR